MTESEFLALADATMNAIELALERTADTADIDVECSRTGNVLEIELIDARTKIIVNSQAPMQEIWMAAKSGGFHYKHVQDQWIDTRSGESLSNALSRVLGEQLGQTIDVRIDLRSD